MATSVPDRFQALFSGAGATSEAVLQSTAIKKLRPGDLVFAPGNDVTVVPLVLSGLVRVFTPAESGHEITLYEIEPGETCVLAASSALAGSSYPAMAVAEAETEAWLLPQDTFTRLFAENELFRAFVFDALNSRLSSVMGLVHDVAFKKMDERLIGYLLRRTTTSDPRLSETQESIAAQLGTAREVVSRILNDLERKGLVQTGRGFVEVTDRPGLTALSSTAD